MQDRVSDSLEGVILLQAELARNTVLCEHVLAGVGVPYLWIKQTLSIIECTRKMPNDISIFSPVKFVLVSELYT